MSCAQVQKAFPEDPWFQHEWGEVLMVQNRHKEASKHLQVAATLFASHLDQVRHHNELPLFQWNFCKEAIVCPVTRLQVCEHGAAVLVLLSAQHCAIALTHLAA